MFWLKSMLPTAWRSRSKRDRPTDAIVTASTWLAVRLLDGGSALRGAALQDPQAEQADREQPARDDPRAVLHQARARSTLEQAHHAERLALSRRGDANQNELRWPFAASGK
jgi:hypothetical protein